MEEITKTLSNAWKKIILRRGWSATLGPFHSKRNLKNWPQCPGDERVRGAYLVWVFVMGPALADASGFAVFVQGASALGEGLASTAHGNNPQVIFFNPALINRLPGTQFESGVTFVNPHHDFHSDATGQSDKTDSVLFFPATVYVTHQYSDKLSFGFGVFTPFGLGTKWDDDWEGRYIVTEAEMQSLNFNPVASYRLTPSVSLAAGVSALYVDASLENRLNLSTLGFSDGKQKFSGDGIDYGFNLGLYWALSDTRSFGATYRSGIDVHLEGDVKFNLPSASLAPTFPNASAETRIHFPAQLHVAFAYSGIERFVFEAGVRWENWSSYDELRFETGRDINGSNVTTRPTDWHDTLTLTMGGRYALNDNLRLLAGFVRGQDPIPGKTFEPAVTDSPHYALTVGSEYSLGRHQLGVAYAFQKWFDRNKANEIGAQFSGGSVADARANGEYQSHSHFLAISFTYVF